MRLTEYLCVLDYGLDHQETTTVTAATFGQAAEKAVRSIGVPKEATRVMVRDLGPKTFFEVTCEITAVVESAEDGA